jgi:hypothetical protein
MKKIYRYLMIVIASAAIFSCSTDYADNDFSTDSNSGWVEFESELTVRTDAASSITIPVFQRSATNTGSETVLTYTVESIEGNAPSSVLGTYTAIIPENELQGEIVVPVADTDSSYNVLVTITSTNKEDLILGLEGDHPVTHTLQICDATLDLSYTGSSFRDGNLVTEFEVTLVPVAGEDNVYTIATAWGPNLVAELTGNPAFAGQFPYSGTLTINDDNTVEIVADDPATFPGGTGAYDPCNKTFDYTLQQGLFTDPFTIDVTLVSNE